MGTPSARAIHPSEIWTTVNGMATDVLAAPAPRHINALTIVRPSDAD